MDLIANMAAITCLVNVSLYVYVWHINPDVNQTQFVVRIHFRCDVRANRVIIGFENS